MNNLKIGRIIESQQECDAIHIAVAPVVAGERLAPGQHVGFTGTNTVGHTKELIGIIDPFLPSAVFKGDRIWMFLYPNTITSLRHEWTHPSFSASNGVKNGCASSSELWLRGFALTAEISYEELLEGAWNYLTNGEYLCEGGKWESFSTPDEFWPHYEIVTGTTVPAEQRGNFFSCTC